MNKIMNLKRCRDAAARQQRDTSAEALRLTCGQRQDKCSAAATWHRLAEKVRDGHKRDA